MKFTSTGESVVVGHRGRIDCQRSHPPTPACYPSRNPETDRGLSHAQVQSLLQNWLKPHDQHHRLARWGRSSSASSCPPDRRGASAPGDWSTNRPLSVRAGNRDGEETRKGRSDTASNRIQATPSQTTQGQVRMFYCFRSQQGR
jgi:hypothetical protein